MSARFLLLIAVSVDAAPAYPKSHALDHGLLNVTEYLATLKAPAWFMERNKAKASTASVATVKKHEARKQEVSEQACSAGDCRPWCQTWTAQSWEHKCQEAFLCCNGCGECNDPPAPPPPYTPPPPPPPTTLPRGGSLSADEYLLSSSGDEIAIMQGDGNFVVYCSDGSAAWATGTDGNSGAYVVFQDDGNLVVYTSGGSALWAPHNYNCAGDSNCYLVIQNDGNLVEYHGDDVYAGWASGAYC